MAKCRMGIENACGAIAQDHADSIPLLVLPSGPREIGWACQSATTRYTTIGESPNGSTRFGTPDVMLIFGSRSADKRL